MAKGRKTLPEPPPLKGPTPAISAAATEASTPPALPAHEAPKAAEALERRETPERKDFAQRPAAPPPLPGAPLQAAAETAPAVEEVTELPDGNPQRRTAKRRPAGPVRGKIAANDDAPSIGGLIYALEQNPSNKPYRYAAIASAVWGLLCVAFLWASFSAEMAGGASLGTLILRPQTFLMLAAVFVPVAVLWFLALLAWRSEELRLRSSTMTEVAIRLAEPDRMAEQSVASLGQAVRRQVSFMNDAVSRALGRAGELEALVHNEVAALERSYEENERRIRSLIQELSGERNALVDTSDRVSTTLKTLGSDVPALIERLSAQQATLANIIQGAGDNLRSLESAVGTSVEKLETTLGSRTEQLQTVLAGYTDGLGTALGARTEHMQTVLESYTVALADALGSRTEHLQSAISEYMTTIDASLSNRTQTLQDVLDRHAIAVDEQLVARTRSIDAAFSERLRLFDEQIVRSTMQIDTAVGERARALTSALDQHAKNFNETITRQSFDIDESLMQGINSVRRTSENITRQSLKAIEGLAGQSEMLRNVSENLLGQIHSVTNRFENQGQVIMKAANALEAANYKIDVTLQNRQTDLSRTLDGLTGRAEELGQFIQGFSTSIEGSMTDVTAKARETAEQLKIGTDATKRAALADIERLKHETSHESERAIADLRRRFSGISSTVAEEITALSSRVDRTSDEVRQKAARTAAEVAAEQARLREQIENLPQTARESTDVMRRALQDQISALEQLSGLTGRLAQQRDVTPPQGASLTAAFTAEAGAGTPLREALPPPPPATEARTQRATPPARPPEPRREAAQAGALRGSQPATEAGREGWSLGDLLARASRDEEAHSAAQHTQGGAAQTPAAAPFKLNIDVMARALDTQTAAAIWMRLRGGQRGIMARSLYSAEGRAAFDEVSRRCTTDPDLMRTIERYLADFDRLQRDVEQKDASGRLLQQHLVSDMGRVYLFLAHASGRLV